MLSGKTMTYIPDIIFEYFARSVPSSPDEARSTLLVQEGQMRLAPDRGWMPFNARQYICANQTEFHWRARWRLPHLIFGTVVDAFQNKCGRLDAKIWGFIPIARGRGADIDRGEIQRYLAELVWCPMAFLHNSELHYKQLSDRLVRVWAFTEDTYIDLTFNNEGDIIGAKTSTRVRDGSPQPWEGKFYDFKNFGEIRIPSKGEVWWETPEGPFVYWKGCITSIKWH